MDTALLDKQLREFLAEDIGHGDITTDAVFDTKLWTPEALQPVYQTFGVFFEKESASESAAGYLVSHTASAFVVDRAGQWRLRHAYETPADDIVHDIVQLLK